MIQRSKDVLVCLIFIFGFLVVGLGIAAAQPSASFISVPTGMNGSDLLRMSQEGKNNEVALLAPEILRKNPQDIDAYIGFAWSLNTLKEYQKALDTAQVGYSKSKDPRLAQAMGEAMYNLGENESSLSYFQEYLSKFPEGNKAAVTFYLCGELYIRMGKYNHADIAFATALQYNPSNARWWTRLGWVREKTSRYLLALKAYEQAVSLNPNLQDAQSGKTRMLAKIQD